MTKRLGVLLVLFGSGLLATTPAVHSQNGCEIRFTTAYVSDPQGRPTPTPKAGEPFAIAVNYTVSGRPRQPFSLSVEIAGSKSTVREIGLANGRFQSVARFDPILCLGKLPCRIIIDPDSVSGDTNPDDNRVNTAFEPARPSSVVEFFNPVRYSLTHTANADGVAASGPSRAYLGRRISECWQKVVSEEPIGPARAVESEKTLQPLWEFDRPAVVDGKVLVGTKTEVVLSHVRIDDGAARRVTWNQLASLPPAVALWKEPYRSTDCKAPRVLDFVKSSLPAEYQRTMNPYDAAERLYCRFLRFFQYRLLPANRVGEIEREGAPIYLTQGWGACHGYAMSLVACFRAMGIPARNVSVLADLNGFKGQEGGAGTAEIAGKATAAHAMCEFYLPTIGWIPVDGTFGDSLSPNGDYPYGFGVLDLSRTFRTAVGTDHTIGGEFVSVSEWGCFVGLQGPNVKQYWRVDARRER